MDPPPAFAHRTAGFCRSHGPSILPAALQPESLDIGSDRQLFLGGELIDSSLSHDATRTLNPPQDIRRVLRPDQPWEALGFIFYCSVVDDGGSIKLYHGSYDAEKKKHFSVASSTDGLHWERPKLGRKSFQGSTENSILPLDAFGSIRMEPVFMIMGESAATAAALVIGDHISVQDVDYAKLRQRLLEDKQVLAWKEPAKRAGQAR